MTEKFDICFAAPRLSPEERARLFAALTSSASNVIGPPVWTMLIEGEKISEKAWGDEAIRRIKEIEEGKAVGIPLDKALARVRETVVL